MFCTLKHNSLSDEAYTFETTTPPFSRKREGRLAKIACTNCRISKLKCSSEPHGCQRCLSKKIDCRYPSPPRGNSHKKSQSQAQTQTQARARAPAPTPPETPQFQPQSRPSSAPVEASTDDDFITVISNQETTYSSTIDDLDLSLGGFEVSDFTTPESIPGLLSDGEYMDPSDAMRPWQQPFTFTPEEMKSPWNSTPEREDIVFSTNSKTSTVLSTPDASDSGCSCFLQAVNTYEAIEVAVWGQNELWRNADDMLRYQKKALIECEELLECRRCTTQSAYTMLLVSMCRRILTTLGDLCHGVSWGGSDTSTNSGHGPEDRKRRKCVDDGTDESQNRGYGISIRNRQLDDDDEHLVLQSLLTARVARLGRLLSTLDKIVSGHSWPAHKAIIRELQARLTTNSFIVEKLRIPWTG
ncbi:hypothetical protein E0Z10_g1662 [Xylaria hypoxylon]|uniref:Zn(2)-C6 fungal-type domain-containing protein n=1 Tax=Xylaria hypoxylon TaxID=37992 RepID=A0A4Z0YRS9_9PEZI|nr:hypothetical protein E0Z10_g1662 [Xylaria hypoxylon]